MASMLVTLDTSHFETSPLNCFDPRTRLPFASTNNQLMSVTADTSHDPIGPCGASEQSSGSCWHSPMAVWSSAFDCGAHPVVVYYYAVFEMELGLGLGLDVTVSLEDRREAWIRVRSVLGCKALGVLVALGVSVTAGGFWQWIYWSLQWMSRGACSRSGGFTRSGWGVRV